MKKTSITFHPKSNCNDNLDCQDMVSRLIETKGSLSNPLVWDLPSVDVYAYVCREVKRVLALDKIAGMEMSAKHEFPKTVAEATFNRQTGMAYFNR